MMRIKLDDIPKEGKQLLFPWGNEALQNFIAPSDPYGISIAEPLTVEMFFEKKGGEVHVTGIIQGHMEMVCHRCLEAFSYPIKISVETFLQHQPSAFDDYDDIELDVDDMVWEFFEGDEIDVDLIVAEEIFLSFPQVVLCSEECKGLCPLCGKNLNNEVCSCRQATYSPFGVLRELQRTISS